MNTWAKNKKKKCAGSAGCDGVTPHGVFDIYIYIYIYMYVYPPAPLWGHQAVKHNLRIQLSKQCGMSCLHVLEVTGSPVVLLDCLIVLAVLQSGGLQACIGPQNQPKTTHRARCLKSWGAWKSWFLMNYHELWWITMDCDGFSWITMNCHELSW